MGRLSDLFDHHKDNVEEGVKKALGKADDTLEVLRKRLEEVEAKLRDFAGDASQSQDRNQASEQDFTAQNAENEVTTSDRTNKPADTSVAAEADQSARRNTKAKR